MCQKLCHFIWVIWWFHRSKDFEAIWRQKSWPFSPGWAANITRIRSWTFHLPWSDLISCDLVFTDSGFIQLRTFSFKTIFFLISIFNGKLWLESWDSLQKAYSAAQMGSYGSNKQCIRRRFCVLFPSFVTLFLDK